MRRLVPLLAVLATVGLACGSSGGSKPAATTAASQAGGASPASPTTRAPSFSGSSSSKYCGFARNIEGSVRANPSTDMRSVFANFDKAADEFVSSAPSAIKADAQTVIAGVRAYERALQSINYDITKITPAMIQSLQDPNFSAAAARIAAYDAQVCGISTPTT